jgi:hypothetical protein
LRASRPQASRLDVGGVRQIEDGDNLCVVECGGRARVCPLGEDSDHDGRDEERRDDDVAAGRGTKRRWIPAHMRLLVRVRTASVFRLWVQV